jgi:CRP-like cAMP-binding protein
VEYENLFTREGFMDDPIWAYFFRAPKELKGMLELLRSLPVFEGLSTNELAQVERMLHTRKYSSGEMVFDESQPGVGMYIIKDGEIEIRKRIGDDKTTRLAVIGKGHFFGEMALLAEIPRSASCTAIKETVLLSLCKPDLEQISERNPVLANKIICNLSRLISQRLAKANENLEILQKQIDDMKPMNSAGGESGE